MFTRDDIDCNDKQSGRLFVIDDRTPDGSPATRVGLSVENDLRWPHKSCGRVLVKDSGRQMGFAAPSVGLAGVGSKAFDVGVDDRILGLVEDDGRADGEAGVVATLKNARVIEPALREAADRRRVAVITHS